MTVALQSALPFVAALALCALRWLPTVLLVPLFAGHALGGVARAVVVLALALPAAPSVSTVFTHAPLSLAQWAAFALKEVALGSLLAALIAAPFWAIEAAGSYLDYQRGGNAQALDPTMSVETSVIGRLLQQSLVVFLMHTGGLHALLAIVAASHAVWPTLAELPALGPRAWEPLGTLLTAAMHFALTLAAPYLLVLSAIEACFAVLSRVNSKFPAYVAALPFKSVVLMLLIALTLPRLLTAAADLSSQHGIQVREALRGPEAAGSTEPDGPAQEGRQRVAPSSYGR